MAYTGPNRRRNTLYITHNTEYHVHDQRCVGVRDLWSGTWQEEHPALGRQLFGAVRPSLRGLEPLGEPSVDNLLWFENGESDILTSRLTAVERPPKALLDRYAPSRDLQCSGSLLPSS